MMLLQLGFVFMLAQNVFSNTLPFYNPRHHGSLTRKATDAQLDTDVKTSDVAAGAHLEVKNLIESQVGKGRINNRNIYTL